MLYTAAWWPLVSNTPLLLTSYPNNRITQTSFPHSTPPSTHATHPCSAVTSLTRASTHCSIVPLLHSSPHGLGTIGRRPRLPVTRDQPPPCLHYMPTSSPVASSTRPPPPWRSGFQQRPLLSMSSMGGGRFWVASLDPASSGLGASMSGSYAPLPGVAPDPSTPPILPTSPSSLPLVSHSVCD